MKVNFPRSINRVMLNNPHSRGEQFQALVEEAFESDAKAYLIAALKIIFDQHAASWEPVEISPGNWKIQATATKERNVQAASERRKQRIEQKQNVKKLAAKATAIVSVRLNEIMLSDGRLGTERGVLGSDWIKDGGFRAEIGYKIGAKNAADKANLPQKVVSEIYDRWMTKPTGNAKTRIRRLTSSVSTHASL